MSGRYLESSYQIGDMKSLPWLAEIEKIAADFHRFQIPASCHWADLRKAAENHGVLIQKITQMIEEANLPQKNYLEGTDPKQSPGGRVNLNRILRLGKGALMG